MKVIAVLALLLQLMACSEQPIEIDKIHGYTMGTSYTVQWQYSANVNAETTQQEIDALLKDINQQMSTYQKDSELSRFNASQAPSTQAISPEFFEVMALSLELNALTNGYFDITVGPVVNLWGFGPDKMPTHLPSEAEKQAAQNAIGIAAISIDDQTQSISKQAQRYIDLSAIAKGYAVDKVAELLEAKQLAHYLVEIGGEMRVKGNKGADKPWRVAVEKPDEALRSVHKVFEIKDAAMATSGDYRNYFEMDGQQYSHTIDPFTAMPVKHTLTSVTIIDDQCARADALATAMLVMGAEKAKAFAEEQGIKAYLIERSVDGFKEYSSPAFDRWQTK